MTTEQSIDDVVNEVRSMYQITKAHSKGDVHIKQPWEHTRFQEWKFNMETDGDSRDEILELPWESTHRQWDEEYEVWVVDLEALFETITHLSAAGFDVTIETDVFDAYHDVID